MQLVLLTHEFWFHLQNFRSIKIFFLQKVIVTFLHKELLYLLPKASKQRFRMVVNENFTLLRLCWYDPNFLQKYSPGSAFSLKITTIVSEGFPQSEPKLNTSNPIADSSYYFYDRGRYFLANFDQYFRSFFIC